MTVVRLTFIREKNSFYFCFLSLFTYYSFESWLILGKSCHLNFFFQLVQLDWLFVCSFFFFFLNNEWQNILCVMLLLHIIKCIYNNLEVFSSLILSFVKRVEKNIVRKWIKKFFWLSDELICFFFILATVCFRFLLVRCCWLSSFLFWISFVFSICLMMNSMNRMLFLNDASQFVRTE